LLVLQHYRDRSQTDGYNPSANGGDDDDGSFLNAIGLVHSCPQRPLIGALAGGESYYPETLIEFFRSFGSELEPGGVVLPQVQRLNSFDGDRSIFLRLDRQR